MNIFKSIKSLVSKTACSVKDCASKVVSKASAKISYWLVLLFDKFDSFALVLSALLVMMSLMAILALVEVALDLVLAQLSAPVLIVLFILLVALYLYVPLSSYCRACDEIQEW